MLISRPSGKEAFAVAKAYVLVEKQPTEIVLDFAEVDVLSPSWADEFITGIRKLYPGLKINCLNTNNESVKATLDILSKVNQ